MALPKDVCSPSWLEYRCLRVLKTSENLSTIVMGIYFLYDDSLVVPTILTRSGRTLAKLHSQATNDKWDGDSSRIVRYCQDASYAFTPRSDIKLDIGDCPPVTGAAYDIANWINTKLTIALRTIPFRCWMHLSLGYTVPTIEQFCKQISSFCAALLEKLQPLDEEVKQKWADATKLAVKDHPLVLWVLGNIFNDVSPELVNSKAFLSITIPINDEFHRVLSGRNFEDLLFRMRMLGENFTIDPMGPRWDFPSALDFWKSSPKEYAERQTMIHFAHFESVQLHDIMFDHWKEIMLIASAGLKINHGALEELKKRAEHFVAQGNINAASAIGCAIARITGPCPDWTFWELVSMADAANLVHRWKSVIPFRGNFQYYPAFNANAMRKRLPDQPMCGRPLRRKVQDLVNI